MKNKKSMKPILLSALALLLAAGAICCFFCIIVMG